jgi:hypothetical protein
MAARTGAQPAAWWRRRSPSAFVLAGIMVVMVVATLLVWRSVTDVLGEVPKDRLGTDPWTATLGVERADPFQLAYIPDCATGSVTRIVLWDEDSEPYWEVSGPPTPMTEFVVGGLPVGFTEVVPYTPPPTGAMVRLVAFRRVGEPIGLRYRDTDLVDDRVVATPSLTLYSRDGFRDEEVCGDEAGDTTDTTDDPADADGTDS